MSEHTILIVDDDQSNLNALQDLLQPQYEIVTASSGLDALQQLKQDPHRERIHLLISDQRMPQLSGAEFLNRTTHLLPHAKRILLTGYTDVEAIIELVNGGELYKFILKPFDHNDVQATVRRALEAFEMEQQNKRLIKQLTRLNENLEHTIEERTQEVQQTLRELELAMQELRELNTTKDKFFSIVAHDLRNTLQALMYASETIASCIDTFDKASIVKLALNMNKMADNLHSLLENLLEWAKIQKGQLVLHPEPCDIAQLIQQSITLFEEGAAMKSISLHATLPQETWALADKNAIKTVLRNLLSNAIKFTYPGGQIHIIGTLQETSPEMIQIIVSDDGTGIAPELMQDILRLERQVTQEGTAEEKGTGLGLPLCKELLEQSGFALLLESTPGTGTRAGFSLPVTTPPHTSEALR